MKLFRALFGKTKNLAPAQVATPAMPAPAVNNHVAGAINAANVTESVSELTMLARHYSGYVRQAALSRCAVLARPELLPVIVDRLNDWVPAVRDTARSAVLAVLPFVPSPQLLATLPAIQHLHGTGRADHTQWITLFEQNLIRLTSTGDIVAAMQAASIKVARACFQLVRTYHLLETGTLLRMILAGSNDIVLAVECVRLAAALPVAMRRAPYLLALAKAGLQDPQSSVRAVATTYLRTTGVDVGKFYRGILQQPELPVKAMQVALISLAALRNAQDIMLVKAYVQHPRPSIRKTALIAWLKLSPGDKDEIASAALMDAAPAVRRFSLHAVRKHGAYLCFAVVRTRLTDTGDLVLLLSFVQTRMWDGLECIVQAAIDDLSDPLRKQYLAAGLHDWLARAAHFYAIPSAAQRSFLTAPAATRVLRALLVNDRLLQRLESMLSH